MKLTHYPDVTSFRRTTEAEFKTDQGPVKLTFQDLPPDYSDRLEQDLPLPNPPRTGVLKENNRILKDGEGRPLSQYNREDPVYKAAKSKTEHLRLAHTFLSSLCEGQIEFTATMNGDGPAYYTAVMEELDAAGFGLGAMVKVQKTVAAISGITEDELVDARGDFTMPD